MEELVSADFDRALRRAFLRSVVERLRGRSNTLMPYRDVRQRTIPERETYRGMQTVRVDDIIGSVDRFRDFDRAFFPRQRHTASRWKSIDRAYHQDIRLPPVQLYKVGDVYFVKDGNHRVSVAREHGVEFIDAEVIDVQLRAPLRADMTPQQILHQLEYAEFLRQTDLDRTRPDHDIRPTALGRYEEIIQHIRDHARDLEAQRGQPVGLAEAAESWYDSIYLPIVTAAREQRVLRHFPGRTLADVYLWVIANRERIEQELGGRADLSPGEMTTAYREIEGRRNRVRRLLAMPAQRLRDLGRH